MLPLFLEFIFDPLCLHSLLFRLEYLDENDHLSRSQRHLPTADDIIFDMEWMISQKNDGEASVFSDELVAALSSFSLPPSSVT